MAVDLDLDAFEREGAADLFTVRISGREYALPDAKAMDYRDAIQLVVHIENKEFVEAMELLLARDDREAFFLNNLPIYKMEALFISYKAHYGVTEAAVGESVALPTS